MNDKSPERLRQVVLDALAKVAPEADLSMLDPKQGLRDQLDLDSMDFLNVVLGIHAALGVDVPERDYPKLATLDSCVEYLARATTRA
jgi:acyl carrier protein